MKATTEHSDILIKKAFMLAELRNYEILREEGDDDLTNIFAQDSKGNSILFQCIFGRETIGVKRIRTLEKKIEEEGIDRVIVVGHGKYSYVARKTALEAGIELIPPDFPSFNIFEHELVPEHKIVPPEEAEELLKRLRVKPFQLPHIKSDDPAVRSIGARPGDILRITRKDSTAGEHTYFRYVV
ncbi:MAG: DNA-directed RNA polymerase subunit H [Candidatus Bathyarchaeota archaeon]|nr:MAG: DNA-directed RNA polymerase subunit H [Candidatus Bathyarchaeota archaeon]